MSWGIDAVGCQVCCVPGGDCERFQTAEDLLPGTQGSGGRDLLETCWNSSLSRWVHNILNIFKHDVSPPISLVPNIRLFDVFSMFQYISNDCVHHGWFWRCWLGGWDHHEKLVVLPGHSGLEKPQFDPQMVSDPRENWRGLGDIGGIGWHHGGAFPEKSSALGILHVWKPPIWINCPGIWDSLASNLGQALPWNRPSSLL